MDRRHFIKGAALITGALCLDVPVFSRTVRRLGKEKLRLGVLSDIHLTEADSTDMFIKALSLFRDRGVDGVVVAGDLADRGAGFQLHYMADAWYSVFPDDKAPDGHHVEKIFIYGNHDIRSWKSKAAKKLPYYADIMADRILGDTDRRAEVWEDCFHEKWAPIYMKEVKGYKFICAHFENDNNVPGLELFMDHADLPSDKPFFYIQHPHPKGTCLAPWVWGQDDGTTTRILSRYPNAVALSGHSHSSLTDERAVWEGEFISINTAALKYIIPFGGRENSKVDMSKENVPAQMPYIDGKDGHQGQIMTVYDNYLTLEKWDIGNGLPLADNWVIPLRDGSFSWKERAERATAPEFSKGAAVSVTTGHGEDRYGVEQDQVTVHFPTVKGGKKAVRAHDYEVQVEIEDVDLQKTVLTKYVYSPKFYLAPEKDADETVCVFGVSELPEGKRYRFAVRPRECFGKKGGAIYSDWI